MLGKLLSEINITLWMGMAECDVRGSSNVWLIWYLKYTGSAIMGDQENDPVTKKDFNKMIPPSVNGE